jgi:acyl-CoA thioesterase superfamily protein/acyl-Coa thioesterase superfamily protein
MTEPSAFFVPDGERFVPTTFTRGPWSAGHQHGGPPAALMARAVELAAGEPESLQITRFTADFLRPVPIEPLTVLVERVRDGRRARGYAVVLSAGDQAVVRATVLVVRRQPVEPPSMPARAPLQPLPDEATPFQFPFFRDPIGYHTAMEVRLARGTFGSGRAAAWMRQRVPLVLGELPSPAQRTLVAADSGSGVGAALDPAHLVPFINADLSVSLHRLPDGEWVGLDAVTDLEPHGIGLTHAGLYDVRGPIGQAVQDLVVGSPGARS